VVALNNIEAMENQIEMLLQTVTELAAIYTYEPLEVELMPAVTMFYAGFGSMDRVVPNTQEVGERWILRVWIHMDDPKVAQTAMKRLLPKIRQALMSNRDLNRTCMYTYMGDGTVFILPGQTNTALVCAVDFGAVCDEVR
jgi:hypothetical protein